MPPEARLKRGSEFDRVYREGRPLYARNFTVLVLPSRYACSRLGITVTRKVDKRAVIRNRIKRRIRELFRLNRHHMKEVMDIVIIAKPGSGNCPMPEIARQILGALRQGGYLS